MHREIMHYFIDGYNLLFRMQHDNGDLQSQREAIIRDLNKKISLIKLDLSIVFDATSQIGDRTRSHYHAIEIVFTAEGETADEYIIDEIKNSPHPQQETVVTSDKKLAWRVRNRSAHTETIEEFMLWLNRAYKNKLRQQKKDKQQQTITSSFTLPQSPPTTRSLISSKEAPPESLTDYYNRIFESEWQEILKKEELRKQTSPSSSPPKRPPRRPKQRHDPFETPPIPEEKEASEMERWLKLFEKRSLNSGSD